jgi:hypothetical protein
MFYLGRSFIIHYQSVRIEQGVVRCIRGSHLPQILRQPWNVLLGERSGARIRSWRLYRWRANEPPRRASRRQPETSTLMPTETELQTRAGGPLAAYNSKTRGIGSPQLAR